VDDPILDLVEWRIAEEWKEDQRRRDAFLEWEKNLLDSASEARDKGLSTATLEAYGDERADGYEDDDLYEWP
jgi:hypothetical protein